MGVTKHHQACDACGETDHKTRRVVVKIDGHTKHRWQLCRACTAIKLVALANHRGY